MYEKPNDINYVLVYIINVYNLPIILGYDNLNCKDFLFISY